jgi:hypothetical protein
VPGRTVLHPGRPERATRAGVARRPRRPPTGPGHRGTSVTASSLAPHRRLRPVNCRHAPHAHGLSEPPRADLAAARPPMSP